MSEALVDLTGGSSEKFYLTNPDTQMKIETGQMWKMMKKNFRDGCIMGCSNVDNDKPGEHKNTQGIVYNHAYGIMEVREIDGLQLIRIRNPWGMGEWNGAFSDEDDEWDKHKNLRDQLHYEFGKDGTWWMQFSDWCNNYNKLYVCKIFSQQWQQYSIASQWKGKTAGGRKNGIFIIISPSETDLWGKGRRNRHR